MEPEAQAGKRSLEDRDLEDDREEKCNEVTEESGEDEGLGESPAKRARQDDTATSDEEQEGRDPGKQDYKEFSKALRALKTLTSEPDDSRDEEHAQRLREMTGRLKQLCNKDVGDGEVPNPHKLLQIHLKHTVLYSEKIRDEDNVKNFLNGLEDGSAGKSDDDDKIYVFLANYATELWYKWNEDELQWYWTPDRDHYMPCSSDVVTGGQWEGETPAPENVEIIAYLDAIRPIPIDEQYIPSLEFDVLGVMRSLAHSSDSEVHTNVLEVMKVWRATDASSNRHVDTWKKQMDEVLLLLEQSKE